MLLKVPFIKIWHLIMKHGSPWVCVKNIDTYNSSILFTIYHRVYGNDRLKEWWDSNKSNIIICYLTIIFCIVSVSCIQNVLALKVICDFVNIYNIFIFLDIPNWYILIIVTSILDVPSSLSRSPSML